MLALLCCIDKNCRIGGEWFSYRFKCYCEQYKLNLLEGGGEDGC
jgi:hypothetical protein